MFEVDDVKSPSKIVLHETILDLGIADSVHIFDMDDHDGGFLLFDQVIILSKYSMTTRSNTTSPLHRILQRNIHQNTHRIGTVSVVRKRYRHIAIQQREQRRRIGRVLGPVTDAKSGTVRVEVVGEVDDGVAKFSGGVSRVATVVLQRGSR